MVEDPGAGTEARQQGRRIVTLVDTDPVTSKRQPGAPLAPRPGVDVRASRVYLFSRRPWVGALRRAASVGVLVAVDVLGLALGVYVALVLRTVLYGDTVTWALLWRLERDEWLPFLVPITVLVFLQAGLYARRERRSGAGRVVSSLVLVALIILSFGLGTGYDFTTTGLIPTAVVTSSLAIGLLRAAYSSFALELMKAVGVRRRVVLVGHGPSLARLHRELGSTKGEIDYEFLGAVTVGDAGTLPVLGSALTEIPAVLDDLRPDELILSEADFDERTVLDVVERAHRAGVKVRLAPNTTELLVQKGEYAPGQGVLLFDLRPPILSGWGWLAKRSFDLIGGALIVVVGLPLWLLIALAVKLESRGPVFYVDRRIGVGEREFGMLKFRTMVEGAASLQSALEDANEASGALFKIRDDPRVTRVGRVLRRFSLDELPQLVNVLRGQMSLVGPRPLPLRDYELLEDWHRARYLVLPGMTGLWQISGRSGLSFDDLVRLDFAYLENWSVWLDITIIAKTIPAVLSGRGAY
jgi:exopolysaccharide biosynthesis polyprenyl glycosylphosphotransferase